MVFHTGNNRQTSRQSSVGSGNSEQNRDKNRSTVVIAKHWNPPYCMSVLMRKNGIPE